MIRNFVFDMGKVLMQYDSMPAPAHYAPTVEDADILLHAIFLHPEWIDLDRGDFSEEEFTRRVEARLPRRLKKAGRDCFENWHLYNIFPMPGLDGLIRELKAKGYGIYVLSNASVRLRVYQHLFPAYDCMDGIVVSGEEHCLKPEPRIFEVLCERYGLKPEECFFTDDLALNIEGAKAFGMDGAVFTDADSFRKLLTERKFL